MTTGERVAPREVLAALPVPASPTRRRPERLDADDRRPARRAVELALEALYLAKRIDKVSGEGETVYG